MARTQSLKQKDCILYLLIIEGGDQLMDQYLGVLHIQYLGYQQGRIQGGGGGGSWRSDSIKHKEGTNVARMRTNTYFNS